MPYPLGMKPYKNFGPSIVCQNARGSGDVFGQAVPLGDEYFQDVITFQAESCKSAQAEFERAVDLHLDLRASRGEAK